MARNWSTPRKTKDEAAPELPATDLRWDLCRICRDNRGDHEEFPYQYRHRFVLLNTEPTKRRDDQRLRVEAMIKQLPTPPRGRRHR